MDLVLVILIQAIICGGFCAFVASHKGRSAGVWFALGFLFSFIALLALMAVPAIIREELRSPSHSPASRKSAYNVAPSDLGNVSCPFCAELIRPTAKICRFCQRDLALATPATVIPSTNTKSRTSEWSGMDAAACSEALTAANYQVKESGKDKWEIIFPSGDSSSFAYSLVEFQRITERELSKCAL